MAILIRPRRCVRRVDGGARANAHHPISVSVWVLAGLAAALTLLGLGDRLGLGGRTGWALDLLAHWPKHLFLLAMIAAGLAGWRGMIGAACVAAGAAAINLALVLGVGGFALPQQGPPEARLLRVASANVHGSATALDRLAREANAYGADVVAIYEVPDSLTLEGLASLFPDHLERSLPEAGLDGLKLNRRSAFAARNATGIGYEAFPGSHGVIIRGEVGGVQLVTTHPPSPGDPDLKADRDRQLARIAERLDVSRPFILAGDFNVTPWGRAYGASPGMRAGDPRFAGTFPAFAGWLGLPIDHIRFGGELLLVDHRVGPDIGSDHQPLFATFALPGG